MTSSILSPYGYDNKRVVVTGGARGIGAALLERLAELGCKMVTVLDAETPSGPCDQFLRTDLSDPAAIDVAVDQIGDQVDALFNNAGVADTRPRQTVFAVNYLAVRRLTERLSAEMPPGSAIVNTASTAGSQWRERKALILDLLTIADWSQAVDWFEQHDDLGIAPYGFTKECVIMYTMWSARQLGARGIRINSVAPGPVDTPLLPDFRATMGDRVIEWSVSQGDGRFVHADDVACALAYLGGDGARSVTGSTMPVDRGFLASLEADQLDLSGL
jgi:NAD(P)-dependent dehydrogenase (short-subunit alcohol dehydrogenase family)